jgi:oxygen-dependent protoporphyrinogen oxidase
MHLHQKPRAMRAGAAPRASTPLLRKGVVAPAAAAPCSSSARRGAAAPRAAAASSVGAAAPSALRAASIRSSSSSSKQQLRRTIIAAAAAAPTSAAGSDDDDVLDAVIVGAGISGLVTAMALARNHKDVRFLVTEARERVGGNITSLQDDRYVWEEGPNSFQPNDSMLRAAVDAGVADSLVLGDPKSPRYVLWGGRLRPTPSGPDALTFDLMSLLGKIRAGLGAIGVLNGSPPADGREESVEQFIRRNLGAEVFERLIEPFCSGVYAGDPSKLSMKAAFERIWVLEQKGGSLVGGALKLFQERRANPPPPRDADLPPKPAGQTVGSFRKGLRTLTDAMGAKVEEAGRLRLNWRLVKVERDAGSGIYALRYEEEASSGSGEGGQGQQQPQQQRRQHVVRARSVVSTAPAWALADLVRPDAPGAADALASFDYPPVGAVTVAYPRSAVREDRLDRAAGGGGGEGALNGFGQLHPRSQGVTTLGTIYSSSLFPGRCPDGEVLLLNYIGGATNRGVATAPEDELVAQVDRDLRTMLIRPDAPPPRKVGVRVWPRAIPQFNVGHGDLLARARGALAREAGWDEETFHLGGNYVSGVALGKCVEYGYVFAARVAEGLEKQRARQGQRSAGQEKAPAAEREAVAA